MVFSESTTLRSLYAIGRPSVVCLWSLDGREQIEAKRREDPTALAWNSAATS